MPYLSPSSSGRAPSTSGSVLGNQEPEPIAIVGMGCRWPGDVKDPKGLWEMLRQRLSGYRQFGDHRFDVNGFHHPNADRPGSMATKGAFLLGEDPRLFDQGFFGMTLLEVDTMDPSQRKLLEVVYEAFENAGETWDSFSGSKTGVFVGNFSSDHGQIQGRDSDHHRPYASTGSAISILSNRVNYILNLLGPSVTIDTACSSSMYALHLAITAMRNGDCDSAIVAACNCIMDPSTQLMMTKLGVLSPTSTCHTFDAAADGYARGEAFSALYLKKMSDAVGGEYPIRAFVRGTAINANGRTGGITHPSREGQEAVIRQAYQNAQLPLYDTAYFECHGTGTPVGDPIEISTIGNVFSSVRGIDDALLIGSIKTNVGHTEAASAIAGIMKVVMALESGFIPPSIGVRNLNPKIDFQGANVEVLREVTPWPAGKLRRASINSFGYGGANGHCIIDHVHNVLPGYTKPGLISELSVPFGVRPTPSNSNPFEQRSDSDVKTGSNLGLLPVALNKGTLNALLPSDIRPSSNMVKKAYATTRNRVLLPFSAHNETSLNLNIEALSKVVTNYTLADVAYTLSEKRSKFTQRTYRIVDTDNVRESLLTDGDKVFVSTSQKTRLGFIFTGQGAQWHAMGESLFQYAVFKNTIQYLDQALAQLPSHPGDLKLQDILTGNCASDRINMPMVSQTVCTAIQVGLVDLLRSWKVEPVAVAGHSSGEIAAAYAAGRITAVEAIVTAYCRGQAVSHNAKQGLMLAVGLGLDAAEEYLSGFEMKVRVAAINSPNSLTLSGDVDAIKTVSEKLKKDGVFNRMLQTGGNAYHSHHMLALGEEYERMLIEGLEHTRFLGISELQSQLSTTSWFSSVVPHKRMDMVKINASYWRSNLESPVRFLDATSNLAQNVDAIVEIGPHAALRGPIGQTMKSIGVDMPYVSALRRGEDGQLCLLQFAGALFGLNARIDLAAVNSTDRVQADQSLSYVHGCMAIDLPPYQYTYGPIQYYESRFSKEFRARTTLRHDLLGSKLPGNAKLNPQWRNVLRLKDLPWLDDHRLLHYPVFPGAGYLMMAVEAASQAYVRDIPDPLTITGFSLQNVSIKSAMRIPDDDYGVEVLLSMQLLESITAKTPSWTSFSISSVARESQAWTEHCTGQVRVEITESSQASKRLASISQMDARSVDTSAWYKKFTQMGLGYGPTFQGLSDIQADPAQNLAVAKVDLQTTKDTIVGGESSYAIHPASLDAALQLALVACHGGQTDRVRSAYVPIHIGQLYVKNTLQILTQKEEWGIGIAEGELRGLRGAYATLQIVDQSDDVILDMQKLRCVTYTDAPLNGAANSSSALSAPIFRLAWKPDIRSMSNAQAKALFPPPSDNIAKTYLFDLFDRLGTLMVVDIADRYGIRSDLSHCSEHIRHFLSWAQRQMNADNEWVAEAKSLTSAERLQCIDQLYEQINHCTDVRAAHHLFHNIEDVLYERKTGLDVLVQDDLLTAMYEEGIIMTGAYPQVRRFFDAIGHANPSLNVIEIGAGTGGATRIILDTLSERNGIKRYKSYTFTDVSSGFLGAAKETFGQEYNDMHFSVLNVEQDPLDNGYQAVYDAVIASQCLHATTKISQTLSNCRKLLKPGGKLIIVENTRTVIGHGLVLGTLTGYWSGISDGRVESPFLDSSGWNASLLANGFSGTDLVLDDYPQPYTTACTIVSTAVEDTVSTVPRPLADSNSEEVYILHEQRGPSSLTVQVSTHFKENGIVVKSCSLDVVTIPPRSRVIAFLDGDNPLIQIDQNRLEKFQSLFRNSSSMILVTSGGIIQGKNPSAAISIGLLRTIGTENPTSRFLSVDVNPDGPMGTLAATILKLESSLQSPNAENAGNDNEFVWQDECLWVSRLVPDTGLKDQLELAEMPPARAKPLCFGRHGPVRADFETPGLLTSLYFKPYEDMWKPLPDDWLEIKVAAVGLNWKDLAISAGRFDMNSLSSEYSGTVHRVGSAVTNVSVGDRVYGLGKGHFGNYVRVPAATAQHLRPEDDFLKMATMPLVYMTVVYGFSYATKLKRGEKLLIQSATGGLGMAAIQLAQSIGAEVFATVGTADKAKYLTEVFGIPASMIFSSRTTSDIPKMIDATGGRGFDVILSTSNGDMLHESIKALAPLGRIVDVGRVDVQNSMTLNLASFQKSATFSSFDLGVIVEAQPEMSQILMQSVDEHFRAGNIAPIPAILASDVSELDQALLGFSKGTHIGKLVVNFQNPDSLVKMVPPVPRVQFDPDAEYIISGGFSGLGRSIIAWMSTRGARYFTVLSRRGKSSPEAKILINRMTSLGATIRSVRCDVSVPEDVDRAVEEASAQRPVKGIVHTAVSYEDLSFDKLTPSKWNLGLSAKVLGTQNLHAATKSLPLDFFVMTTSLESVLALATQSAYTAANNFQEVFARYRRSQGLPASTASFGLITDVGHLSTNITTINMMARNKVLGITEYRFLRLLEPAFLNNDPFPVQESKGGREPWIGASDDPLSAVSTVTCLDPALLASKKMDELASSAGGAGSILPKWYTDARVSLVMRAFEDADRSHNDESANHAKNNNAGGILREDFEAAINASDDRNKVEEMVTRAIQNTVAEMLFIDASGVDPTRTVAEYGVDSLIAAELRNWFNTSFMADISMLDLLDTRMSMKALAKMVVGAALSRKTT
ncbi:unnamed protein product [Penicillium discolor]